MIEATTIRLATTAIWAASHVTQYGLAITSLNGIQDAVTCNLSGPAGRVGGLKGCIEMPSTQFGFVVSIFTLGGLAGSLAADSVTRQFGRLGTFRISALCVLIGSSLVGSANTMAQMLIGRIIVGLGSGLATVSVPLFLGEIAPSSIKKALGIMNQLFIVFGMFIGQLLSLPFAKYSSWRYVLLVSVIMGVVQILGSFLISVPTIKKDAKQVTHGERSPLLQSVEQERANGHNHGERALSIKDLFTTDDKVLRRGLYVVMVAQISQQLCGISPVMYFSTRILKPVFNGNSKLIAVGIVACKIPLTILPATFIEKSGIRPILLISAFGMIFWAILLAWGLNVNSGAAAAVAMVSYVSFFSCGLGPVSWVVLSDVMPSNATTAAGAVAIGLNWILNFIMGAGFLPLQQQLAGGDDSKEGNVFYVLAASCAVCFIAIRASFAAYDGVKQQ